MQNFTKLIAIARREAGAMLAEDVVQDALLVAIEQGRKFVGVELKPEYYKQAAHNLRGAGSQMSLFAGAP